MTNCIPHFYEVTESPTPAKAFFQMPQELKSCIIRGGVITPENPTFTAALAPPPEKKS